MHTNYSPFLPYFWKVLPIFSSLLSQSLKWGLLSCRYPATFSSRWVLLYLTPSFHTWTVSPYFSWVKYPFCHLLLIFYSWDFQELSATFVWLSAHWGGPFLSLEGNDPWKTVEVCMSMRACVCEAYYSCLKKDTKSSISSYYWLWFAQWFWPTSCQLAHHPSAVFTSRAILPHHNPAHSNGGCIWIHHS